jgi:hypothetical protein
VLSMSCFVSGQDSRDSWEGGGVGPHKGSDRQLRARTHPASSPPSPSLGLGHPADDSQTALSPRPQGPDDTGLLPSGPLDQNCWLSLIWWLRKKTATPTAASMGREKGTWDRDLLCLQWAWPPAITTATTKLPCQPVWLVLG